MGEGGGTGEIEHLLISLVRFLTSFLHDRVDRLSFKVDQYLKW